VNNNGLFERFHNFRADHGLSVVDSFHFDDGDESLGVDSFGREPFIVRFRALNCGKFIYNI